MALDFASQYLNYFDEIYKREAVTRLLETPSMNYEFKGNNQVFVNTMSVTGNSDYSRTTGYVAGTVANAYVGYTLDMDRGVKLGIDAVNSDEARVTAGNIQHTYLREKFFPELDLYRFTKIYTKIAASAVAGTNIVEATLTSDNVVAALDEGIALLNDAEVPINGRVIYISEAAYSALKGSGEFNNNRDATVMSRILNREVQVFDGHILMRVPSTRFNSAATFGAGSNTLTGEDLNFVICHVPAIMGIIKRSVLRVFTPEQNLDSDSYLMTARQYHGCDVYSNKVSGVYIHKKAA